MAADLFFGCQLNTWFLLPTLCNGRERSAAEDAEEEEEEEEEEEKEEEEEEEEEVDEEDEEDEEEKDEEAEEEEEPEDLTLLGCGAGDVLALRGPSATSPPSSARIS